jgi:hypothetical protein
MGKAIVGLSGLVLLSLLTRNLGESGYGAYATVVVAQGLGQLPRAKKLIQAVVASIPMAVLVWWLDLHVVVLIVFGAACYFLVLRLVGGTVGMPRHGV